MDETVLSRALARIESQEEASSALNLSTSIASSQDSSPLVGSYPFRPQKYPVAPPPTPATSGSYKRGKTISHLLTIELRNQGIGLTKPIIYQDERLRLEPSPTESLTETAEDEKQKQLSVKECDMDLAPGRLSTGTAIASGPDDQTTNQAFMTSLVKLWGRNTRRH
jgi:hypothetical protein